MGNIWAVHRDPKYWENPEEFRPSRFLNDNGEFTSSPHVIPFGVGPRYCLGKKIADTLLFHQFIALVRRFKILATNQDLPSLDEYIFGTSNGPISFKVVMEERHTNKTA